GSEQDPHRGLDRAAGVEQAQGEVEVDVGPLAQQLGLAARVAAGEEALQSPPVDRFLRDPNAALWDRRHGDILPPPRARILGRSPQARRTRRGCALRETRTRRPRRSPAAKTWTCSGRRSRPPWPRSRSRAPPARRSSSASTTTPAAIRRSPPGSTRPCSRSA